MNKFVEKDLNLEALIEIVKVNDWIYDPKKKWMMKKNWFVGCCTKSVSKQWICSKR